MRQRYTDEFRASAVLMLEAAGYPDKRGSLTRTSQHLGVPRRSLARWFHKENNPPPGELVTQKRFDLIEAINREIEAAFTEMDAAREEAGYKDLTTAAAILIDKRQLLSGQPTERSEHLGHIQIDDAREQLAHLVNRHASRIGAAGDIERPN